MEINAAPGPNSYDSGYTARSNIIKGPGLRISMDVRRTWRCPACQRQVRLTGSETTVRCQCGSPHGSGTWMTLIDPSPPPAPFTPPPLRGPEPRVEEQPEPRVEEQPEPRVEEQPEPCNEEPPEVRSEEPQEQTPSPTSVPEDSAPPSAPGD